MSFVGGVAQMLTSPAFLMGLIMLLREPKQKPMLTPLLQHLCWRNQVCTARIVCPQAQSTVSVKPEDAGSKSSPTGCCRGSAAALHTRCQLLLCAIRPLLFARFVCCAARVEGSHLQHLPTHRNPSRYRCGSVQAWVQGSYDRFGKGDAHGQTTFFIRS